LVNFTQQDTRVANKGHISTVSVGDAAVVVVVVVVFEIVVVVVFAVVVVFGF
jgi:hypothetical protein